MSYFKKCNIITGWAAFAISAIVYLMTTEPTASLWDCAEFIATSYKLQVGHPPGAPLFMMIGRLFSMLAPSPDKAALMVNIMSCLCSAVTILFMFWSITHLARRIYAKETNGLSTAQIWTIMGAGLVGSLAYAFTDTFWFSAIEAEVYAMSSMFTAIVFWAILQWENVADQPHSTRWLILIAYLMGLSIGVHILNLLTIPALVFVYYFKKYQTVTTKGVIGAIAVSLLILGAINSIIIPYTVAIGAWVDRMFVNGMGLPVNSGLTVFVIALAAICIGTIYLTHKKGKVLANTIVLCVTVILLGYGSYASVIIRAAANPPMNSNDPSNPYALLSLLNRDQYGNRPLLYGPYYSSVPEDIVEKSIYSLGEDGKYHEGKTISAYKYTEGFEYVFPRMYSSRPSHVRDYKVWGQVEGQRQVYDGELITVPTFGENLRYFFSYQLNFMYWRYFLWNFVGRQSDVQSTGEITDGNWLSGINAIDQIYLGPQENLPSEMKANKGRNTYYFLPFILGIVGLMYQLNRDKKNFTVVMWLFVMMGIALVVYFNTTPGEPRERDYVYAGSFYAFCMWIGLGVMAVADLIAKVQKKYNKTTAVAATAICAVVPVILIAQNWDDHDRSHRYVTRDVGYDYLQSTLPNSIILNYGDNDTFPLWYNQEVEGVRPDVRIMNMSYLGGDWYIDQMKIKANESEPVPFTIPKHKYSLTNDYIFVIDKFGGQPVEGKLVVDFIKSDNKRTQQPYGDEYLDFVPATNIAIPVNKENAIRAGIVKEEDAHLMVDTVYLNIKKSSLDKSEMMFLDLLANFNWERPIFFTQVYALDDWGLKDYLQFDGYAYRLVPIKTPYKSLLSIGRIDVDYLYDNLMNKFRYGNLKDPRVYADYFIQTNHNSTQTRNAFARLASGLLERGDTLRAVEVLDYGVKEVPFSQIRHTYILTIPVIEAYYNASEDEKANAILEDYAANLIEYIEYYSQFPDSKAALVEDALTEKISYLGELYTIALDYGQREQAEKLRNYFKSIGFE